MFCVFFSLWGGLNVRGSGWLGWFGVSDKKDALRVMMAGSGGSDFSLTVEELDLLVAECQREQTELKEKELAAALALATLRRKLRNVAHELDYLELLKAAQSGDFADALTESCTLPCPTRYRAKTVLGTLTLRRSKLVLERAKRLQLDRDE